MAKNNPIPMRHQNPFFPLPPPANLNLSQVKIVVVAPEVRNMELPQGKLSKKSYVDFKRYLKQKYGYPGRVLLWK